MVQSSKIVNHNPYYIHFFKDKQDFFCYPVAMKYFLNILLFCFTIVTSPLHAQEMSSQHQAPFGSVTLSSCTTGLRTQAPLYLGINIEKLNNWQIQSVDITPTANPKIPIALFTPFQQPYKHIQIYPISATLNHETKEPITFEAVGSITACQQKECIKEPIHLAMTLPPQKALITPECYGISLALANTPIPMYMNKITGWAIPQDDNNALVTLDFNKLPKTIQLYTQDQKPLSVNIQTDDKRVQFLWPITGSTINLYVRTYYHYYQVSLPLLPPDTPLPLAKDLDFNTLQAIFLFFLISALPIFWARTTEIDLRTFKKQAQQMIVFSILCGILGFILFYSTQNLNLAFYPFSKWITLMLMMLGLVLAPAHPAAALFFTFIAPKPYLAHITQPFNQTIFIGGSVVLIIILFTLQLIYSKQIYQKLHDKKSVSALWWAFRLPWIALMLYTLFYL